MIFVPVVIGLGVSSLLWYWLFSADFGLINRILSTSALIDEPILWLGMDADTSRPGRSSCRSSGRSSGSG